MCQLQFPRETQLRRYVYVYKERDCIICLLQDRDQGMLVVWFRGVRTREVMAYFPSLCLNVQKPGTSKVREKSLFRSMKHAYIYISIYLYLSIYIYRERKRLAVRRIFSCDLSCPCPCHTVSFSQSAQTSPPIFIAKSLYLWWALWCQLRLRSGLTTACTCF